MGQARLLGSLKAHQVRGTRTMIMVRLHLLKGVLTRVQPLGILRLCKRSRSVCLLTTQTPRWSSGLGRRPLTAKNRGSNPLRGTTQKAARAAFFVSPRGTGLQAGASAGTFRAWSRTLAPYGRAFLMGTIFFLARPGAPGRHIPGPNPPYRLLLDGPSSLRPGGSSAG